MNCWNCNTELIWGGDHDDEDGEGNQIIVTNLSCPECESLVLIYYPIKEKQKK